MDETFYLYTTKCFFKVNEENFWRQLYVNVDSDILNEFT